MNDDPFRYNDRSTWEQYPFKDLIDIFYASGEKAARGDLIKVEIPRRSPVYYCVMGMGKEISFSEEKLWLLPVSLQEPHTVTTQSIFWHGLSPNPGLGMLFEYAILLKRNVVVEGLKLLETPATKEPMPEAPKPKTPEQWRDSILASFFN